MDGPEAGSYHNSGRHASSLSSETNLPVFEVLAYG